MSLAICVSTLLMIAEGRAAPEPDDLALIPIEQNIVKYTNAERARHGLPELEIDADLLKSARKHATWMTLNHTLRHTSAAVAENIAMGQKSSREVVAAWMASSGHRANILNRRYARIGVAAYRTESGRIYWCQQFLR